MTEVDVNGLMDKIERLAFQAGLNQGLAAGGAKTAETKTAEARPVKPEFGCDAKLFSVLHEKVNCVVRNTDKCVEEHCPTGFTADDGTWVQITVREYRALAGILDKVAKLM